jgi:hypothetical protein
VRPTRAITEAKEKSQRTSSTDMADTAAAARDWADFYS